METIIIKLDSRKMKNPDLDIRYLLPDAIEKYTDNKVCNNGYDYISDTEIGIWLETQDAKGSLDLILKLLKKEEFCQNDLSETAEIYISSAETAEFEKCEKVYPA